MAVRGCHADCITAELYKWRCLAILPLSGKASMLPVSFTGLLPMIDQPYTARSLLLLLAAIALITLPHFYNLPLPLMAFFMLMWCWRGLAVWYPQIIPNRWWLSLLTVIGMGLLYRQHSGLFGRDAGVSIFVVSLGLKLLEIHGRRDVYLIVYLAFIVAASQFLYEQSLWMAGYFVLICGLLLTTLITQNVSKVQTSAALKTSLIILAQALPITVVIFMLFPRLEAPRWMWLEDTTKAKSGLSSTLEPGSISDLSLSDELVFRVRFEGEVPPPEQRYWRGPVYSHTDGKRWTAAHTLSLPVTQLHFGDQRYQYNLLMEPQKERWVFALEMAEYYQGNLHRNHLLQLLSDGKPGERAEYRLTSAVDYQTGSISQAEYDENLQLPAPVSAKVTQLLSQLQAEQPQQLIQNVLRHFQQQNFFYTLTPPLMPDNPIETFLFETHSGYCSHYATAFVYLMRAAGIPARVVGGYQGGEFNQLGDFLEVRQASAHAWAEVWLEPRGWVRVDPTTAIAPERVQRGIDVEQQIASRAVNFALGRDQTAALNWLKRSRLLWQSLDYQWQHWVINYSSNNQNQLLQLLGIEGWAGIMRWLGGAIVTLTLPLAWWLLRQPRVKADPALKLYQGFCGKLAKAGITIQPEEGPRDFAERAKQLRPELATQIEQITVLFIRLRYERLKKTSDLRQLKTNIAALRI